MPLRILTTRARFAALRVRSYRVWASPIVVTLLRMRAAAVPTVMASLGCVPNSSQVGLRPSGKSMNRLSEHYRHPAHWPPRRVGCTLTVASLDMQEGRLVQFKLNV